MRHDWVTESGNPASNEIDSLSPLEMVRLINAEDARVAAAVGLEAEHIAAAIDVITETMRSGGRLIYIGAGTSGRLGVLDASECPPTFNSDPRQVVGLIAGGNGALTRAIEGAEDDVIAASRDLQAIDFSARDCLVGIATSGRTPYVLGGVRWARELGAKTIGLACNLASELSQHVDIMIAPIVGPEVISGSTRMKAGTATKMVLNMLTTGAMVRLGKTHGNLMVDLRASNSKLVARARRLVAHMTSVTEAEAEALLERCNGEVKTAIVMQHLGVDAMTARKRLSAVDGHLRQVIG
jgi:N-acetylmuramic acid 6-phosphate etherase